MKYKCIIILSLLIIIVGKAYADDKHTVYGRVADSFTYEPMPFVNVVVMRPDSSFVVGVTSVENQHTHMGAQFKFPMEQEGEYILRLSYVGYETTYKNIMVKYHKRMSTYSIEGTIFMKKSSTALDEVTVKATKIKMVMKKDTIIYNADAFQLSQGSMLDQLIRQLPGAELKDNGQIYINGKYVNNLLLNGEDFFKGDPKIALDNLPAYMVDKVKVYEKQSAESEALGIKDMGSKPLVVDVSLKRQYNVGWMANADVGYGTSDRYAAKLFGLRFSDYTRLALFANLNNTNDTRQPGQNGDWSPQWSPSGLLTSKTGGVDFFMTGRKKRHKLNSSLKVENYETDDQVETAGTTFLSGGDMYTRSRSATNNQNTKIETKHTLELKPGWAFIRFTPQLVYYTYKENFWSQEGTFTSNPMEKYRGEALDSLFAYGGEALKKLAVNRRLQRGMRDGHKFGTSASFYGSGRVSKTSYDVLSIYGDAEYIYWDNHSSGVNDLRYMDNGSVTKTDFRHQYTNYPYKSYNYKVGGLYNYGINEALIIAPGYAYTQRYRSNNRLLYRLDNLEGWGEDSSYSPGMLPSTQDSLKQALDIQNSYYSKQFDYVHNPALNILYMENLTESSSLQLDIKIPTRFEKNKLDYQRAEIDTSFVRSVIFFEPKLRFIYMTNQWGTAYDFNYSLSSVAPDMTHSLDIRDDVNPLSIQEGNPNLLNMHTHHFGFSFRTGNTEKQQNLSFNINSDLLLNAFCQSVTYDKQTGASTFRPDNINGNWNISGGFNFSQPVDKNKRLTLTTNTNGGYVNSVDLIRVSGESESRRSSVRNWNMGETLRGEYRLNSYFLGAKVSVNWTNATSDRPDFIDINSVDFNYGVNGQMPLPWKMELSTDLTMYSRRGYSESNLNTNELLWNARLAKRFMNGNLTLILDGFDILGNLSSVRQTLNAQGRKESFYNVIPRYGMLHVIYRLNREPKKKK